MCNLEINDIVTFVLSAFATIISIRAYFKSKEFHKQNILVHKIEKILAIIEDISTVYGRFLNLTLDLDLYYDSNDKEEKDRNYNLYIENRTQLLNQIDIKKIDNEIRELEVLARAYLKNDAQIKVQSFNRMFKGIIDYTINMDSMTAEMFWKEGFPNIDKVNTYADKLCDILLDEIGFQESIQDYREKLREYSEKEFKKDLGIKKTEK